MRRNIEMSDLNWDEVMIQNDGYLIPIINPASIFYAASSVDEGLLFAQDDPNIIHIGLEDSENEFPCIWFSLEEEVSTPLWNEVMKQIEEMF